MKQTIKEDIAVLKVLMEDTRSDIKDIKDNHLAHIYKTLEGQKTWMIGLLTTIILTLIATIINFIVK